MTNDLHNCSNSINTSVEREINKYFDAYYGGSERVKSFRERICNVRLEQIRNEMTCAKWIWKMFALLLPHRYRSFSYLLIAFLMSLTLLVGIFYVMTTATAGATIGQVWAAKWLIKNDEIFLPDKALGVDFSTWSGLGWDEAGMGYVLADHRHIYVTHNRPARCIYFRTKSGKILSRNVEDISTISIDSRSQIVLGIAKLDQILPQNEIDIIPVWSDQHVLSSKSLLVLAGNGRCGWQKGVQRTTIGGVNGYLPFYVTYIGLPRNGNMALQFGDSGSPCFAKHDGRWYVCGIAFAVHTFDSSGKDGWKADCNYFVPLSVYETIIAKKVNMTSR